MAREHPLAHAFTIALSELRDRGIDREALAVKLGVRAPTISRWASGERTIPVEQLPAIDALCGRPRGYILRLAGYVSDAIDVRSAIATDPAIDAERREILLNMYDIFHRDSAAEAEPKGFTGAWLRRQASSPRREPEPDAGAELRTKMEAARKGMQEFGMAPEDIEAVMAYVEESFPELDNGPAEDAG